MKRYRRFNLRERMRESTTYSVRKQIEQVDRLLRLVTLQSRSLTALVDHIRKRHPEIVEELEVAGEPVACVTCGKQLGPDGFCPDCDQLPF